MDYSPMLCWFIDFYYIMLPFLYMNKSYVYLRTFAAYRQKLPVRIVVPPIRIPQKPNQKPVLLYIDINYVAIFVEIVMIQILMSRQAFIENITISVELSDKH